MVGRDGGATFSSAQRASMIDAIEETDASAAACAMTPLAISIARFAMP